MVPVGVTPGIEKDRRPAIHSTLPLLGCGYGAWRGYRQLLRDISFSCLFVFFFLSLLEYRGLLGRPGGNK